MTTDRLWLSALRWAALGGLGLLLLGVWVVGVKAQALPGEDGNEAAERLVAAGAWWVSASFVGGLLLTVLPLLVGSVQALRTSRQPDSAAEDS